MKAQAIKFLSDFTFLRQQHNFLGQTLSINFYREFVDAVLNFSGAFWLVGFKLGIELLNLSVYIV